MTFCRCRVVSIKKGRERNTTVSLFEEVQPGRGQVTQWGIISEVWDLWGPHGARVDLRVPVILAAGGGAGVKLQGSWVSHQVGEQHQQKCQFCPLNRNEGTWAFQALPLCNHVTLSSRELSFVVFTPGYMSNSESPSSSELLDFYTFAVHVRQRRNKAWESPKVKGGIPKWLAVPQK